MQSRHPEVPVHQNIQAVVAGVHKNDAEVAALWQEFGKLAPLDDLGLEAGNVIELEDDNVWSDEDCAAERDETDNAKTEQLPSRSSTACSGPAKPSAGSHRHSPELLSQDSG